MTKKSLNILLVCDASVESGSGHVMRQITLGIALKKVGLNPILFCYSAPEVLINRALEFEINVRQRSHQSSMINLADEIISEGCSLVVFDGYEFNPNVISKVFEHGIRVVLVDDNGDMANLPCNLIINQNLHADASMYAKNYTSPRLLLGLSWALIRPEICAQIGSVKDLERKGIFISIGGTDHLGLTSVIRNALEKKTQEEIVATSGFGGGATLTPLEMAVAMSRAKLGIIACGTTLWEAVFLKLPFIGIITAENQVDACDALNQLGNFSFFDARLDFDVSRIVELTLILLKHSEMHRQFNEKTLDLIDGRGALRVALQLQKLLS